MQRPWCRSRSHELVQSAQRCAPLRLLRRVPKPQGQEKEAISFMWIQEGITAEPREMIRGRILSEMIRIQARKSELQTESRSYGPEVRVTAGQTPRIRAESPTKGPEWGFGASTENPPPLKPS